MHGFLTPSMSLYTVTAEQVTEFQQIVDEYAHIALLVLHEDHLDLFTWKLVMDIYFRLADTEGSLIYLLERGMVAPVTYLLMHELDNHPKYQNIQRKASMGTKERFINAVYIANALTIWAFERLEATAVESAKTGDIEGVLRNFPINIDELPEEVVAIQSNAVITIKEHLLVENTLNEVIDEAMTKAYELFHVVQ